MNKEEIKTLEAEAGRLFYLREANLTQVAQINNRLTEINNLIRQDKQGSVPTEPTVKNK